MSARTDIFDAPSDVEEAAEPTITPDTEEDTTVTETQAPEAPKSEGFLDEKAAKLAAQDAEHLPNVEAFQAVVDEAVEAADPSTGTVSEADLERVATAYREVTGGIKYKNLARDYVDKGMSAALEESEYIRAVAYNEVNLKLRTTKAAPKAAAPKVDPKEAYAARVAAAQVALEYLESNPPEDAVDFEVPSTEAAYNQATEYLDWVNADEDTRGDEPELDGVAAVAVRIIQGKGQGLRKATGGGARAPFNGTRRNVGNHITEAFEGHPSGTFLTISEIVKFDSAEYGDDHPSSGAVAARLAGKSVPEGIEAAVNDEGTKGAVKL